MKEIIQKNDHILEISNSVAVICFKQTELHEEIPFQQEKSGHFKLILSKIEDE